MVKPMLTDADLRRRRLREGRQFLSFFVKRQSKETGTAAPVAGEGR
jgi:hypothetical protein